MIKIKLRIGVAVQVCRLSNCLIVAHCVHMDNHGAYVDIFECPNDWLPDGGFKGCQKRLGPILAGIGHAIKSGRWRYLGWVQPEPFEYPKFLMNAGPDSWYLFDGKNQVRLGATVPASLQGLENLSVWPAEVLEERIATGINLLSYDRVKKWPAR